MNLINDASKCISYLTIELSKISEKFNGQFRDWVFGCDICQDVCPWNKFSSEHNEPLFEPLDQVINYSKKDWIEITEKFDEFLRTVQLIGLNLEL